MNYTSLEIEAYLRKAEHALEVARSLLEDKYPADAAGKVYYAMYYATQALLKASDIHVIRHSAVKSALGYHFVKSGKMEARFHKMLINARKIREIADYDLQEEIIETAADLKPEQGEIFLQEIRRQLSIIVNES